MTDLSVGFAVFRGGPYTYSQQKQKQTQKPPAESQKQRKTTTPTADTAFDSDCVLSRMGAGEGCGLCAPGIGFLAHGLYTGTSCAAARKYV